MSELRAQALDDFRRRCKEQGLAFTFQRQVIYEAVADSRAHPTPELIYAQVRQRIPSISLGTIYKNVKTFLDSGLLKEVTLHHGSLRLESDATLFLFVSGPMISESVPGVWPGVMYVVTVTPPSVIL